MQDSLIMKANENVLWFSVILLTCLGLGIDQHYLYTLIFWVIIIISVGNAKRFYSEEYLISFTILRINMYVFPFLLPYFFNYEINIYSNQIIIYSFFGLILGILFILPKWDDWKIVLSKDLIELSRKQKKIEYFTSIYMLIGAAIVEELFFRNFIIGNLGDSSYMFAIITSSFLFFLNHFGVKWDGFTLYDYLIQIIFSVISGCLFIFSESILPSIILHLVYNFPLVVLSFKKYQFHYLNKENKHNRFQRSDN